MFKGFTIANLVLILSFVAQAHAADLFPRGPNPQTTPGHLCEAPSEYRYEEKIPYCERNVSSSMKRKIIADYDAHFGYSIQKMPRNDFKIDHLIPLSVGGSNDVENLWPQHKSVYDYSDPLESDLSVLMTKGKIKQAEAVRVILECKHNLERCEDLGIYLRSLM